MKAAEEEDRDKAKFGFELNHEVTWTFDDKDVPKGSVGTVVGFTENHVKVKFSSGTWNFKPSELRKAAGPSHRDNRETFSGFFCNYFGIAGSGGIGAQVGAGVAGRGQRMFCVCV